MTLARELTSREAHSADKKTEILHTAAEIFCSKGFHGTAMSEIASAVGLTKAGLYYYVDDDNMNGTP